VDEWKENAETEMLIKVPGTCNRGVYQTACEIDSEETLHKRRVEEEGTVAGEGIERLQRHGMRVDLIRPENRRSGGG